MAGNRKPAPKTDQQEYLFIQQGPSRSHNVSFRTVASQARRWTSNRKNRNQRSTADQGASYARSLVGWDRSSSGAGNERPESDNDHNVRDESSQLMLLSSVGGGLRSDPFNSLPVGQSKPIMGVTDYFIHIWTELKATNVDTLLGFNTYLTMYWPLAQQDELLMSALLSVARSAQCLASGQQPQTDSMVLQHGAKAMMQLRQRLATGALSETVIFTMDWLINIAYMANDYSAFNIHWAAFRPAAERFIQGRNDTMTTVVRHRLKSWETLHDYREHIDHFTSTSDASLTYLPGSIAFSSLPNGFSMLVNQGLLSLEMAEILVLVHNAMTSTMPLEDGVRCRTHGLLTRHKMSHFESHIGLAVLALTHQLERSLDANLGLLDDIAQAYINRRLLWDTDLERRSLIWSSLILGNILLTPNTPSPSSPENDAQIQSLRAKGHIILVTIWQELALAPNTHPDLSAVLDPTPWQALQPALLDDFLLTPPLAEQLRRTYEAAVARHREWDGTGLLMVGKPLAHNEGEKPVVCVEYLVLREGRGSLPRVEVAN